LEWLKVANLIKGEGNPKDKGKSDKDRQKKSEEDGGKDEKFKQTQDKQRRGY
jgi:hypothetical protein